MRQNDVTRSILNAARRDEKREVTPYKIRDTELKLGGLATTIQFAARRRALRASVAGASDRSSLRLLGSSRSSVPT